MALGINHRKVMLYSSVMLMAKMCGRKPVNNIESWPGGENKWQPMT
jgi:hypothetical protein